MAEDKAKARLRDAKRRATPKRKAYRREWLRKNRDKTNAQQRERSRKNRVQKICLQCGRLIEQIKRWHYCSDECDRAAHVQKLRIRDSSRKPLIERVCKECGQVFVPAYGVKHRIFCSRRCNRRYTWRTKRHTHRQRAKHFGVPFLPIDPRHIYRRDNWICGICGQSVDCALKYPHPLSASLDHIVPMSQGGGHTERNLQLAHLYCNILKGTARRSDLRPAKSEPRA